MGDKEEKKEVDLVVVDSEAVTEVGDLGEERGVEVREVDLVVEMEVVQSLLVVAVELLELDLIRTSTRMTKRSLKVTRLVLVRTPWLQGLLQLHLVKLSRYHLVVN